MADIWVGVNGADEALRQVNAEMLGGARALADQAGATVVRHRVGRVRRRPRQGARLVGRPTAL